jgi:hypothetical protein
MPRAEPDFEHGWPVLRALLENAAEALTRRAILRAWPDTAAAPALPTLWKWLSQVVREGHVLQHGRGTRNDPHKYSLPGMIDKWQAKFMEEFTRQLYRNAEGAAPASSP